MLGLFRAQEVCYTCWERMCREKAASLAVQPVCRRVAKIAGKPGTTVRVAGKTIEDLHLHLALLWRHAVPYFREI